MITGFAAFVGYFRKLSEEHTELQSFVHGASERIISESRSDLKYPCLWLETPSMRLSDNQAQVNGYRETAFIVFHDAPTGDYDKQDELWAKTEQIALDVLARMLEDSHKLPFRIDLSTVQMDPIHTLFVDNEYGWRVEFRTSAYVPMCYHAEKWKLPPPPKPTIPLTAKF